MHRGFDERGRFMDYSTDEWTAPLSAPGKVHGRGVDTTPPGNAPTSHPYQHRLRTVCGLFLSPTIKIVRSPIRREETGITCKRCRSYLGLPPID